MRKLILVFLGLFLFLGCDEKTYDAKVIDKIYVPSNVSMGTGFVNGNVIVQTQTSPEQYLIFIEGEEIDSISVTKDIYFKINKGDTVVVKSCWHGDYIREDNYEKVNYN